MKGELRSVGSGSAEVWCEGAGGEEGTVLPGGVQHWDVGTLVERVGESL